MLDVPEREATAAAWEKQLRNRYPDHRVAHSLAALWYWWALHESSPAAHPGLGLATPRTPPDSVALWQVAAAYWAMLAASEDFWATRPRASRDLATQIAQRMEQTLREQFDRLAMGHRGTPGRLARPTATGRLSWPSPPSYGPHARWPPAAYASAAGPCALGPCSCSGSACVTK